MSKIRAVIMDMDGVSIHGDRLISGAREKLRSFEECFPYQPSRILESIADFEV